MTSASNPAGILIRTPSTYGWSQSLRVGSKFSMVLLPPLAWQRDALERTIRVKMLRTRRVVLWAFRRRQKVFFTQNWWIPFDKVGKVRKSFVMWRWKDFCVCLCSFYVRRFLIFILNLHIYKIVFFNLIGCLWCWRCEKTTDWFSIVEDCVSRWGIMEGKCPD